MTTLPSGSEKISSRIMMLSPYGYRRYPCLLASPTAKCAAPVGVTFNNQVKAPAVLAPAAEDKAPHLPGSVRFVDNAREQSQAQEGEHDFRQWNIRELGHRSPPSLVPRS